mmetsp:Transcript_6968/g.10963  ORF Transcript_6968/g.10963 Transcript_6968/m.10963 type:complete len:110 (-) Transcript_6968:281-610(-)
MHVRDLLGTRWKDELKASTRPAEGSGSQSPPRLRCSRLTRPSHSASEEIVRGRAGGSGARMPFLAATSRFWFFSLPLASGAAHSLDVRFEQRDGYLWHILTDSLEAFGL